MPIWIILVIILLTTLTEGSEIRPTPTATSFQTPTATYTATPPKPKPTETVRNVQPSLTPTPKPEQVKVSKEYEEKLLEVRRKLQYASVSRQWNVHVWKLELYGQIEELQKEAPNDSLATQLDEVYKKTLYGLELLDRGMLRAAISMVDTIIKEIE